jgi:hypothetical protein
MQTIEQTSPEIEETIVPIEEPSRPIELIEEPDLPRLAPIPKRSLFSVRRVVWALVVVFVLMVGAAILGLAPMIGC